MEKISSKKVSKVLKKKYILFIYDLLNVYKNVSIFNLKLTFTDSYSTKKKEEMLKLFILTFVLKIYIHM